MLNCDFVSTRDVYHYTSLSRHNNDVIIALCVRWDRTTLPLRPRLHYIKHTVHWLYCSGCWFHLGSAYLHITPYFIPYKGPLKKFHLSQFAKCNSCRMAIDNVRLACTMAECPAGPSLRPSMLMLQQKAVLAVDFGGFARQQAAHMPNNLVGRPLPMNTISGLVISAVASDQPQPLQNRQSIYSIGGFRLQLS